MIFYDTLDGMLAYYKRVAESTQRDQKTVLDRAQANAFAHIIGVLSQDGISETLSYCWEQVLRLRTWLSEHNEEETGYTYRFWAESVYWRFLVRYTTITDDISYMDEE